MSDTINATAPDTLIGTTPDALGGTTTFPLKVDAPLSGGTQRVTDSAGTDSALAIGTNFVGVNTTAGDRPETVFAVKAAVDSGAMLALTNPGTTSKGPGAESSIRFANTVNDQWWHVGMGGNTTAGTFFIWGKTLGAVLQIEAAGAVSIRQGSPVTVGDALAVNGPLTVKGAVMAQGGLTVTGALTASGGLNVTSLHGIPAASTAPANTPLAALAIDPTGRLYVLGPQVP